MGDKDPVAVAQIVVAVGTLAVAIVDGVAVTAAGAVIVPGAAAIALAAGIVAVEAIGAVFKNHDGPVVIGRVAISGAELASLPINGSRSWQIKNLGRDLPGEEGSDYNSTVAVFRRS